MPPTKSIDTLRMAAIIVRRRGSISAGCMLLAWAPCALLAATEPTSLAKFVPGDVRLFVEVRNWNALSSSPAGGLLAERLQELTTTEPAMATPVSSQVTSAPSAVRFVRPGVSWRDRLSTQIGLRQPGMIELITAGRLAIAADGWRALGDAVLVTQPIDPSRIESLLASQIVPAGDSSNPLIPSQPQRPIRRYRLANDHELASDGMLILIGRRQTLSGLYARTLALWNSEHGVSLSDTADYHERTAMLPSQPQALVYISGQSRLGAGSALPPLIWPAEWNKYQSLAGSLLLSADSATIDLVGYPSYRASKPEPKPGPSLLRKLPASTLLAWTQPIDYVAEYRRLGGVQKDATVSFYREVLGAGLPPGTVEKDLLSLLSGDTLFVLSQVARPTTNPAVGSKVLWIPALTLAVPTNDADRTSRILQRVFGNLLTLLNVRPTGSGPLQMESIPIGPGGGMVGNISVGQLLANGPAGEILGQLQLSWSVADGLLIVGTASESVRELILARRGQAPLLAQRVLPGSPARSASQTVLLAQPILIAELVSSWASFFRENQSSLLRPDWWAQLQSVRAVSLAQLGAIPARSGAGTVPIAHVIPELPAGKRLRPGDVILGVDGRPLASTEPLASLELLLATRPRREAVVLRVVRDNRETAVELPIPEPALPAPNLGPAEFLQQASRMLRLFETARYSVASPTPEVFTSRLELQFVTTRPAR